MTRRHTPINERVTPRRASTTYLTERWALVLVAGLSAVALAACGGSSDPTSAKSSGSTSSTAVRHGSATGRMKVGLGTGAIGAPDPTTTLPNERGNAIEPVISAGQNLIITSKGTCLPQTLEANVSAPVVWTNLSGKPQRVVFKNFPVDSGTIPPSGTFTWSTNDAVALAYTLEPSGWVGKLLMNPVNP